MSVDEDMMTVPDIVDGQQDRLARDRRGMGHSRLPEDYIRHLKGEGTSPQGYSISNMHFTY